MRSIEFRDTFDPRFTLYKNPGVEILRKLSLRVTDTEKTFLETAAER